MNHISSEVFSELKRVFLGGLEQPQSSWIMPVSEPFIDIYGPGISEEENAFCLDFGSLPPLNMERRTIFIANITQQELMLWVGKVDEGIDVRWQSDGTEIFLDKGCGEGGLIVTFNGTEGKDLLLNKSITLVAEMESGVRKEFRINVKIRTFANCPYGEFNFNGCDHTGVFDFGIIDLLGAEGGQKEPYWLAIKNSGNADLKIGIRQLPAWLLSTVNENKELSQGDELVLKSGNELNVNFEPIISLDYFGIQEGFVRLETNDIRISFQNLELRFSVNQKVSDPYVVLREPLRVETGPGELHEVSCPLLNWGDKEAELTQENKTGPVTMIKKVSIPMAVNGIPGEKHVLLGVKTKELIPGEHRIDLNLTVRNSRQGELTLPVIVTFIPPKSSTRPNIKVVPSKIEGEIFRGIKTEKFFEIRNQGKGLQKIKVISKSCDIEVIGDTKVKIEPGSKQEVRLLLNLENLRDKFFKGNIELVAKDLNTPIAEIPVHFEVKKLAGKLCPVCGLISPIHVPFCEFSGTEIISAKWIPEELVATCTKCGRVYSNAHRYCVVDGTILK